MTPEEIEAGVERWYKMCDEDQARYAAMTEEEYRTAGAEANGDQTVWEFLGITNEEFDHWRNTRLPRIEIGPDVDTIEPQRIHVVLGVGHFDKWPLCGADTLWGCYEGTRKDVTCPKCLAALNPEEVRMRKVYRQHPDKA